jgi:alpha,alpha-trehalase
MKKIVNLIIAMHMSSFIFAQAAPDIVYGNLFKDVQLAKIFPDGKTFVDCTPKRNPKDILADYARIKSNPAIRFSLKLFVEDNFNMPPSPPAFNYVMKESDVSAHIKNLWSFLKRDPVNTDTIKKGEEWRMGSLLPLPNPYIVPGGRFREVYYWDSYFTMLGLKESGETQTIINMVENFAYQINKYGHIPNGNRTYYLSRSQPPFFSLMVNLLAGIKGEEVYKNYLPALEKEYAYWMDKTAPTKHVVKMPDGALLNRYYDTDNGPRQESYAKDYELSSKFKGEKAAILNRNLRSGAESGWDFSSRWFASANEMATIQVLDIIPVDLNALLYNLETTLQKAYKAARDEKNSNAFANSANSRYNAIEKYCWNAKQGYYFDYNYVSKKQNTVVTAAGVFPMCFFNLGDEAMQEKGNALAAALNKYLLKDGGILTTPNKTGQQWDAPNGWAPLQWMSVWALQRTGQKNLAIDIAKRWTAMVERVYKSTSKLMEKYNVIDAQLEAGGGEYPGQDGFGWTNGVYLAMKTLLPNPNAPQKASEPVKMDF